MIINVKKAKKHSDSIMRTFKATVFFSREQDECVDVLHAGVQSDTPAAG